MKQFLEIINIVLPVFLVIGLGWALKARGTITRELNDGLSRVVFYVAAPALLFRSVAIITLEKPIASDTIPAPIAGSVLAAFLLYVVMAAGLVSVLVALTVYFAAARTGPAARGVMAQASYRSNMVFVGLPVITNAFGPAILGPAAVFISFMTPIYNVLAVLVLTLPFANGHGRKEGWIKAGRDVAFNPLIISCALGIVWSALSLPLPKPLDTSLKLIGEIAMPLALIVVGASLDLDHIRARALRPAMIAAIKLIIYPGIIFIVLRALGVTGQTLEFVVLLMATPTAVVSTIMAKEMRGDHQLAGAIVILSTLGSLITITAWLALFSILGSGR